MAKRAPAPCSVIFLKTEIDHAPMDCYDDDPRKVWVIVPIWSYRRAVLTHARPFLEAADTDKMSALEGKVFLASLDPSGPPPFEHESGERLEWPELRLAPPISEIQARLGVEPPASREEKS